MKKCESCQKEFEDNIKFCTQCGNPLKEIEIEAEEEVAEEETINKVECPNCHKTVNDFRFCSICGCDMENYSDVAESEEDKKKECPKCHHVIENEDAAFCEVCGTALNGEAKSVKKIIKESAEKVKDNDLVKAVKQDISGSQSIKVIKDKTKETIKKGKASTSKIKTRTIKIIAVVVAILVVGATVALNIHTCEECEELYFGKKNKISWFGEHEYVCKDCYEDFYGWR